MEQFLAENRIKFLAFLPDSIFVIPKDNDTQFCPEGAEPFVFLDDNNKHGGDGTRSAFFTKSLIFTKRFFV